MPSGVGMFRNALRLGRLALGSVQTARRASNMAAAASLRQASLQPRALSTEWLAEAGNTQVCRYPYVWLRDNCQCPQCFQPVSKARLLLMRDLDLNAAPSDVKVNTNNGAVNVTWPDGHESSYSSDWLWRRRFSRDPRSDHVDLPIHHWGAEMQDSISKDSLDNLLSDDSALYRWLNIMERVGLFIITDAPLETGQVHRLADRVGFARKTSYGEAFTVKAKVQPSNIAYTTATLGLHTDLPQYNYVPGVQMLHCIGQVPTRGGENEFSDGFHVAEQIRRTDPEAFRILTNVPVRFSDEGVDYCPYHTLQEKPTITLREDGAIERINYNNQIRDSIVDVAEEDVEALYRALRLYDDLLYAPQNTVHIKLKEGEIVCFHNYRVLHGRKGFSVVSGGERHLEGNYIDWDEMRSKRRVLEAEMAANSKAAAQQAVN